MSAVNTHPPAADSAAPKVLGELFAPHFLPAWVPPSSLPTHGCERKTSPFPPPSLGDPALADNVELGTFPVSQGRLAGRSLRGFGLLEALRSKQQ